MNVIPSSGLAYFVIHLRVEHVSVFMSGGIIGLPPKWSPMVLYG